MARERSSFGGVRLGRTRRNRAGGRSGGRSIGFRGFRFAASTKGLNAIERRMVRSMSVGDVDAALGTTDSSGALGGKITNRTDESYKGIGKLRGGIVSRSAYENARLWNAHRKDGRNPFVYDRKKGVSLWARGASVTVRTGTNEMVRAALTVANFMLEEVQRNVAAGNNMKPLSERYRKWKEKYHYGKPILMLTGQAVKSLRPKVIEAT